ncbi:MAG TPA: nucleotidyl transferase AbiEii/AbiGii toxin family protein [Pyrinomonadaceae bacterium]|nr:nucleotidyl transferase AbiEii/AbiGii toxin family protein [Pyrinomonadaceae bacterium]
MPKLYDELRKLISALDRGKIEYALCGGIAMAIHGRPRATVDIDILIAPESLPQMLRIAEKLGYAIRGLDMSFGKDVIEIRRVSKIDRATRFVLTLDMILVTDAIRDVWETRVRANLEGGKLSVVSKEGLIALKKISGRPQDIADISALSEDSDAAS